MGDRAGRNRCCSPVRSTGDRARCNRECSSVRIQCMRKSRVLQDGALYHVTARANRKEMILDSVNSTGDRAKRNCYEDR